MTDQQQTPTPEPPRSLETEPPPGTAPAPTPEPAPDTTSGGEPPPPRRSRFTLPSAYTILFAPIVLVAIATWVVPAGTYQLDDEGSPVPGTYEEVEQQPQRILVDSLLAPINGLYGIEGEDGSISVYNTGALFGAIDVALFILVIRATWRRPTALPIPYSHSASFTACVAMSCSRSSNHSVPSMYASRCTLDSRPPSS